MTRLDDVLDPRNPFAPSARMTERREPDRLGVVIGGSLADGVRVRLDRDTFIEGLAVGSYVTILGQTDCRFFGLITDLALDATDPRLARNPPEDELSREVFRGTAAFGVITVKPMLKLDAGSDEARPVKTVPTHFTVVRRASPEEVAQIFESGGAGEAKPYQIGASLDDKDVKITLDLERLVERSSAVFGRSGTGKTFLTLPLLASIIHQQAASALIFDMHNDYGWTLKGDRNRKLKGLKRLDAISERITIVSLDDASSRARNATFEFLLRIGYGQVEPEDIEMLKQTLSLSEVQVNTLFMLQRRFPHDWFARLLSDEEDAEVADLIENDKIVSGTYAALQRKLGRMRKFGFLGESLPEGQDPVTRIVTDLIAGRSVVIEFGRYGNDLPAYLFVANYLTRRIHKRYVELKEAAEAGGPEPTRLVIAIEEAHKFLEPEIASHTIFGTIAREMRKYNVTLLIIDQRPSQIEPEVLSQIGTRITCALSDEKDIGAVFSGVSGASQLRGVLAGLESKQQALIFGHAVPMPVVVRTTTYDEEATRAYVVEPASPAVQRARARVTNREEEL
ncbi:MAG: ATP-binding protein [Thermoflexales bacterium]|nr:ATP-binding protein [Thermoflexales bacterium]